jgi:hypothetical protein
MPNTAAKAVMSVPRKTVARVALFDLSAAALSMLSDCFRQFGIVTVPVPAQDSERLRHEKFEACVLPLSEAAGAIISLARSSPSNSRIVIYGVGGTAQDSLRYSRYCLNAVFQEPLERAAVLKLVRSTRLLVLHEFRRYARVPIMTEVSLVSNDGGKYFVTSQEISSGGMSARGTSHLETGQPVEVSFSLLTLPRIWIRGNVTWKKPNKSFGIRFDPHDDRRMRLKEWIEGYLES